MPGKISISKQVLLYPSLDLDFSEFRYPLLTENGTGYFVESAQLAELNGFYTASVEDIHHPFEAVAASESEASI